MSIKRAVILFISILVIIMLIFTIIPSKKRYYKMSIEKIDQDIRRISADNLTIEEKLTYYSERFLKAPYDINCQGDGPNARYEQQPLLNLKKVNCMTYCEIVLALSLSEYYEEMFNILQHLRYYKGIIGMATRNHYTMADWLPANSWCLDDVTQQIGGKDTTQLSRIISHRKFFEGKGITDIPVYMPDQEITIDYVPLKKLKKHTAQLNSGDIVALIQDMPGIFSAHMLLIIKKDDFVFFRHASRKAEKVIDSAFDDYISELSKDSKYLGMSFMRVKENIQWTGKPYSHGKFIIQ